MTYVVSILTTAILFVLLILLLSVKPSISKKITVASLAFAGISGFFIYGYGYTVISDNVFLASLKALLAVCGSFIGQNDFGSISSVPIMNTTWMQIAFALIRVLALYATASAVISTIGREALKSLRLWLIRRGTIHLIYGISDDTLSFGRELVQGKQGIVIFVSEKAISANDVSAMGYVLKADAHAVKADVKFLRSIGFHRGHRRLTLYALSKSSNANIRYAKALLDSLRTCDARPEDLRLVVLGQEESAVSQLQSTSQRYGYGFVSAVNEPQLASRLLTLSYPPCNAISFDVDGRATYDLDALIVGFGQVGQSVLKSLVMNGQFEGSGFHVSVFATDCTCVSGRFTDELGALQSSYDISFYSFDARSTKMYEYLAEHRDTLKYVVICTGNEDVNHEIAVDLTHYFHRHECSVPVFVCSKCGVDTYADDGTVSASHSIYRKDLLCSESLDQMAMVINHRYQNEDSKSALQHWMECDYFSRQSCRASADFVPAMLRAAGKTAEQVLAGDWSLTDAQRENLSKTEHLRWCAFHYCMGFSPMTDEEFDSRARLYREQLAQNGKATVRIGKNMASMTHACLVGWDELRVLSEKEAEITGKYTDYHAMDTENVLAIPELLRAERDMND